jgi:hypothetical protein
MDDEQRDEEEGSAREQRERDVRGRPFVSGNPFRFPQGVSGNPNGRPKGIGALIDQVLSEQVDTKNPELGKREALELMVRSMVRTAMKGGSSGTGAFRELMDRRFGRVPLALKIGPDEDDGPRDIRIRVVGRDDVDRDALRLSAKSLPGNGNGNGDGGNGDAPA